MGGDIDDLNSERQLILSARPLASPWTAAKFNDWYLIVTVWSTKILPGQRIFFLVFSVLPSAFRKAGGGDAVSDSEVGVDLFYFKIG